LVLRSDCLTGPYTVTENMGVFDAFFVRRFTRIHFCSGQRSAIER
jgi:hypothetical protein